MGDPIDWVVRHAPCDVLLVDNLGYENPKRVALSSDGGPYAPLAVSVAEAVATANDGTISLWYPADVDNTEKYKQTRGDYQSELSEMLSVPVAAEPIRTDGGQPHRPDLLVRRGADHRLRDVLFDDRPTVPNPGCTTVTVLPHESSRPPLIRRLLERVVF